MEYVIGFVLGMLAATLLIRWMAQRAIAKFLDQIEQTTEQEAESKQLSVNLEFEQNIYFLYNSKDGSFVAQGSDFAELKRNLLSRFPNSTVTINSGDTAALENLKSQIEDLTSINENKTAA